MLLCNIVDEFLDKHSLSNSGSSEKSDLSSLEVRFEKIDHLDSCEKYFLRCCKILKLRRFTMYREGSVSGEVTHSVYGFTDHIHHTASDLGTDRHRYRRTGTDDLHSSFESVCRIHGY